MKKFVIGFLSSLLLTVSTAAIAGPYGHGHRHHGHHFHHRHWHHNHGWIVPALIGGAVVYAATRPDNVIVQPAPVVVQNQYVVIDGITYKKEIMIVNGVHQEVLVRVQ